MFDLSKDDFKNSHNPYLLSNKIDGEIVFSNEKGNAYRRLLEKFKNGMPLLGISYQPEIHNDLNNYNFVQFIENRLQQDDVTNNDKIDFNTLLREEARNDGLSQMFADFKRGYIFFNVGYDEKRHGSNPQLMLEDIRNTLQKRNSEQQTEEIITAVIDHHSQGPSYLGSMQLPMTDERFSEYMIAQSDQYFVETQQADNGDIILTFILMQYRILNLKGGPENGLENANSKFIFKLDKDKGFVLERSLINSLAAKKLFISDSSDPLTFDEFAQELLVPPKEKVQVEIASPIIEPPKPKQSAGSKIENWLSKKKNNFLGMFAASRSEDLIEHMRDMLPTSRFADNAPEIVKETLMNDRPIKILLLEEKNNKNENQNGEQLVSRKSIFLKETHASNTIGIDFNILQVGKYNLNIWDLAGVDRMRFAFASYARNARVVICFYDDLNDLKNLAPKVNMLAESVDLAPLVFYVSSNPLAKEYAQEANIDSDYVISGKQSAYNILEQVLNSLEKLAYQPAQEPAYQPRQR